MSRIHDTPELHKSLVIGLLQLAHEVLTDNKIKYFIEGGLLLGAVREGHMIAHDDDADICIFEKDAWAKLLRLIPTFQAAKVGNYPVNIEIHGDCLFKLYIPGLWVTIPAGVYPERVVGTPTLDIFRCKIKDKDVVLYSPADRKRFKGCIYSQVFPLKLIPVKSSPGAPEIMVYAPNNPMPFLLGYYGKDCLTVVRYDNRDVQAPLRKKT